MSVTTDTATGETAVMAAPPEQPAPTWITRTEHQILADNPDWAHIFDGWRSSAPQGPALYPAGCLDDWSRDAKAAYTRGTDHGWVYRWEDDAHADSAIEEARALAPDTEAQEHALRSQTLAWALKDAAEVLDAPEPPALVALPAPAEYAEPGDGGDPADDGPAAA